MEICDGCEALRIERPVNRYDVWHACCTEPDKPAWLGARRTVDTAPASSELGPIRIRRPVWCGRSASRGPHPPQAVPLPPEGEDRKNELPAGDRPADSSEEKMEKDKEKPFPRLF